MEEDNLMLKNNVMERVVDTQNPNQQMLDSDNDSDDSVDEITFIRSLSEKEKAKRKGKLKQLRL